MRTFTPLAAAAMMIVGAPVLAQATPGAGATATTAPSATAPAAAATAPAAGAAAAAPTKVAAGQTVYDTAGGVVGTVDKVEGQVAVLATGKNNVGLPLTSFAMGPNGPVINMTKDQVDAAATAAAAKTAASVTAGASVKDTSGGSVGTIKSVEGEYALLDTTKVQVKLPLSAFAAQGDGLIVSMTKAQIEAAAAASTPAPAAASR
ncbi:hypothetical protein [Sphingomonas profundi]|uniref:hypothetical protein n=1 Tax=Alterirhizorhabdus profundi TaxID=2681549 RepID=UPI0012E719EF|nr:hypothetical protein [Sphingomonas profundi]